MLRDTAAWRRYCARPALPSHDSRLTRSHSNFRTPSSMSGGTIPSNGRLETRAGSSSGLCRSLEAVGTDTDDSA